MDIRTRILTATGILLALTSYSYAQDIEAINDAMKKIGPAWACGAPYEYREALDNLRTVMSKAGLPTVIIDGGIKEIDRHARSSDFTPDRERITRSECIEKYGIRD